MKKRVLFGIIAAVVTAALILVACKKSVGTPEDNASVSETPEDIEEKQEIRIGFSAIDMENPYFITLESAVKEVLGEEEYKLVTKDPGTDPDKQADQIQEMIEEGIDAIILSPVNWEKITPSLEALHTAGVKIINVDTQVKKMDYVDAYIGSDNHSAGVICGEDLIERCPEGGKVAILECPTQNSINDRITGFEEQLATAEKGFEVVAREDTGGEFEKALEASQRILKEHPDIVAIMCGNDQLAVGAKTALNIAKLDEVLIYGVDGSPDIKKELKKPETQIAGTAAQSPISMGKSAARLVIDILEGNEYEKETYEEVFMINKDNVDMYGTDSWQ
ncbi:sugar ABC transporter substrate-binding protein [Lachnospiraceae bacterium 42-17]|jgi:ABC-type sugar transport system substrate-binding protein|nr:sugar ABC transporter substrate-binding protein [Dorea sp.]